MAAAGHSNKCHIYLINFKTGSLGHCRLAHFLQFLLTLLNVFHYSVLVLIRKNLANDKAAKKKKKKRV